VIITVCGHRPNKLGGYKIPNPTYETVVDGLLKAFGHFRPEMILTGMAIGVDQWAAELCIQYNIPFLAAVPFNNQEQKWPPHSQAKYQYLVSQAAHVVHVSKGEYTPAKMHIRNEWMVDRCHLVVAVWDGSSGGTASAVGYAKSIGRPIHFVPIVQKQALPIIDTLDSSPQTPANTHQPPVNKEVDEDDLPKYRRFIDIN
jgi:uncharacterized phage-like protein YoqJ